ncbi:hypothetical protein ACPPVQ_10785 [Diaminobutyricibacter sp. McL0618]|uniref:hypothetical protein n=1 Tax=Leifsonia sp. McL0618 TaxID=3415677 RepID=UPI003CE73526
MTSALPQALALGVGAGGALVDVSAYVIGPEGVAYAYGRQSEFRDPSPGQVTFTLENQDGRFTPGNTASPLATLLTEGTAMCWQLGSRLVTAQVAGITFAADETQWGRIQITAGDVFTIANRTPIGDLAHAIAAAQAYLFWPFNDAISSPTAAETSGNNGPALYPDASFPASTSFGVAASAPTSDTQVQLAIPSPGLGPAFLGTNAGHGNLPFPLITYPAGSYGYWGFWVTPAAPSFDIELDVHMQNGWSIALSAAQLGGDQVGVNFAGPAGAPSLFLPFPWLQGVAHYVATGITYSGTTFTGTLYVDGVAVSSGSWTAAGVTNAAMQPTSVRFTLGNGSASGLLVNVAHLSHGPALAHEEAAGVTTIQNRIAALAAVVPQMALGTLDANLSPAPLGGSASNAWTGLCDVLRTEQGHIYTSTTGTLTAPATVVNVRARTRPATPQATFDARSDVQNLPQFVRDMTNMFATITAAGPAASVSVTDPAVVARVGSAASSETVLLENHVDLLGWAQDRMIRGENVNLRVAQVTIDTMTTSAATQAAVMALTLGDRVRISNLDITPLGFSTWDGWLLGVSELHAPGASATDSFTLYLSPVLPKTAVFDTDRFSAGGVLSLNAALTAGATSMLVLSADGLSFLEQVQTPYVLEIDSEQVTVTACSAPASNVQTVTITRGANGTTAAAHSAGALVDIADTALFAF